MAPRSWVVAVNPVTGKLCRAEISKCALLDSVFIDNDNEIIFIFFTYAANFIPYRKINFPLFSIYVSHKFKKCAKSSVANWIAETSVYMSLMAT